MRASLLAGISIAAFAGRAAYAQQADPAGAPVTVASATGSAPAAADDREIVVTAAKRSQNLQDVPISVTAVSESRLQAFNVTSTANISAVAPGVVFVPAPNPNVVQFVVRGVGTFAFADTLEQSVGVAIDGVPLGRVAGAVVDAIDVSRIEMLRGPQGTLFGKSATAGLVSVINNKPQLGDTTFTGRALYGEKSEFRVQGTANLPIVQDVLALRLSGWNFQRDGYLRAPLQPDGNIGDFRNRGVRARLGWQTTQNLRIDLFAEIADNWNDGTTTTTRSYLSNDFLSFNGGPTIAQVNAAMGIVPGPNNRTIGNELQGLGGHVKPQFYQAEANLDLGGLTLTSLTAYRRVRSNQIADYDYSASQANSYRTYQNYQSLSKQLTSELRLANASGSKLQYTFGAFYYDLNIPVSLIEQDTLRNPLNPPPFYARGRQIRVDMTTKNYAAFTDLNLRLGKFNLIGGARVSRETSDGTYNRVRPQFSAGAEGQDLSIFIPGSTAVGFPPFTVSTSVKITDFSWRVGGQYHVTNAIMAYVTASRAYKGPGFNFSNDLTQATFDLNNAIVKKEVAHSYEVGVRSQFFDRTLTLNVSAYRAPFDNFQITAAVPNAVGGLTYTIINAGQILAKGIEADFGWRPRGALEGFSIDGNAAYNDTKYSDFANAPCYTGQAVVAAPTTQSGICAPVRAGSTATIQSVNGLRTVGSPRWQLNFFTGYERPITGSLAAFGRAHYFYQAATQYGVGNNPATLIDGYGTVDLTIGIRTLNDRWKLSVIGKNIFDKSFAARAVTSNPGLVQIIPYEAQSSWVLALDVKF
jgi:iron complex outermembrane receptor protein